MFIKNLKTEAIHLFHNTIPGVPEKNGTVDFQYIAS